LRRRFRTAAAINCQLLPGVSGSERLRLHVTLARGRRSTEEDTVATKAQTYNGYCVKCKEKRDFEGTVEVSKTGMNMAKGKCPVCGTTVNRILGKAAS
jgi:tRNA G26 N,N-dimethylase Trm1